MMSGVAGIDKLELLPSFATLDEPVELASASTDAVTLANRFATAASEAIIFRVSSAGNGEHASLLLLLGAGVSVVELSNNEAASEDVHGERCIDSEHRSVSPLTADGAAIS